MNNHFFIVCVFLFSFSFYFKGTAQSIDHNYYYRLSNTFLKDGRSLDTYSNGNNLPFMGNTGNYLGQKWRLIPIGNGYYRLSNKFLGMERSLDTYSNGENQPFMGSSGNYSGQFWKLTPIGNGNYRLTNSFLKDGRSLDTYSNNGNKPFMGKTGNYSGQIWKLTRLESINNDVANYHKETYKGFTIYVQDKALKTDAGQTGKAIALLKKQLSVILGLGLKDEIIAQFKTTKIFVDWDTNPNGGAVYHPSKQWLLDNGYIAEKEKSIEITCIKNFLNWSDQNQPYVVLHELAHGYHHRKLGYDNSDVKEAYNTAITEGLYNSVRYHEGGGKYADGRKAYSAGNEQEYFAELTEAYLGQNDYFPFNRKDLQNSKDKKGYELMKNTWLFK